MLRKMVEDVGSEVDAASAVKDSSQSNACIKALSSSYPVDLFFKVLEAVKISYELCALNSSKDDKLRKSSLKYF